MRCSGLKSWGCCRRRPDLLGQYPVVHARRLSFHSEFYAQGQAQKGVLYHSLRRDLYQDTTGDQQVKFATSQGRDRFLQRLAHRGYRGRLPHRCR